MVLRRGDAASQVFEVAGAVSASAVFWNRRYGGPEREVDGRIMEHLAGSGVLAESHAASLLFEPWTIQTKIGGHYSVFTPFWKACNQQPPPREPLPRPHRHFGAPAVAPLAASLDLEA